MKAIKAIKAIKALKPCELVQEVTCGLKHLFYKDRVLKPSPPLAPNLFKVSLLLIGL